MAESPSQPQENVLRTTVLLTNLRTWVVTPCCCSLRSSNWLYRGLRTVLLRIRYVLTMVYFDHVARGTVRCGKFGFQKHVQFTSFQTCFHLYHRRIIKRLVCSLTPHKFRCHVIIMVSTLFIILSFPPVGWMFRMFRCVQICL